MKIAIDISQIIYGTGVSMYTEHLVKGLMKIDTKNEYRLFGGSLRRLKALKLVASKLNKNGENRIYPIPPTLADLLWNRLHEVSIDRLTGKIDVFHSSDWTQPAVSAFKVTTVHDLAPIRFPKLHDPKIVSVHKRRLELVKNEVDRVIVPSNATKKDLIDFGVPEEKIRVIYEGAVHTKNRPKKEKLELLKKRLNIPGKYLLSVGAGPRKNTDRIISAFDAIRSDVNLKLVIVGSGGDKYEERRGIRFTGHLSDEDLGLLYFGAEVLVYPSIYEGFGLPIIEAFNAGVPVVTSNLSSMEEVAGKAGVLVDPYSVDSIAGGIKKAIKNATSLVEKGKNRAKDFSWEKAARETLEVYKEATV